MRSLLFSIVIIPIMVFSKCRIDNLIEECPTCCAILYSSDSCEIDGLNTKINIKEKGRGPLGAMWDNVAQAVVVRNGCLLEAWDLRNQTGPKRTFGLDGYEVYNLQKYSFATRMSSLRCDCGGDPIPEHRMIRSTTTEPPDEIREILTELELEGQEEEEEGSGQISSEDNNSTIQLLPSN